jgi:hypothetical protein
VKPDDFRRPLEGAEHEYDSAVLAKMSDGFDAAAGQIQISNGAWAENAKRIEAFGRKIHVAMRIERGGRHKENMLRRDELPNLLVNNRAEMPHISILQPIQ